MPSGVRLSVLPHGNVLYPKLNLHDKTIVADHGKSKSGGTPKQPEAGVWDRWGQTIQLFQSRRRNPSSTQGSSRLATLG